MREQPQPPLPNSDRGTPDSFAPGHYEGDYSARDAREVAALFPVLSAEVADRLLDLLLPHVSRPAKRDEAA